MLSVWRSHLSGLPILFLVCPGWGAVCHTEYYCLEDQFNHAIATLSPEYATKVCDLILSPPEDDPFKALKDALVQRTAASEQCRLQQLFNTKELGDRKPTQLLRHMKQLLGDKATGLDHHLCMNYSSNASLQSQAGFGINCLGN